MLGLWIFIGLFGGFILLSILFLLFPTLIHKKKKQGFHPKHISHRGGAGERLENTIAAFRNATEKGTGMFEIDVQLTKDGKVVISHDNNLKRTTGEDINITECDYDEIPPLLSKQDVTFTGTFTHSDTCTTEGDPASEDRKIALLRSVLERFPDMPLNIDTKDNDDVIEPTIKLIREFKREHNVVMANVRSEAINIIHRSAPELLLSVSMGRTYFIVICFYLGLLPFLPLKESFFQTPLPKILLLNPDPPIPVKKWHVTALGLLLMRPALFRHLRKRGMQVHIWTVNEEEDMELCCKRYHADGIMSDYPEKLAEYLKRNAGGETDPLREGCSWV